jgi:phage shock protein PspC (stress-responsive transcriptional regulator)
MKRTLNINIGNSIIHIEEDAYELLRAYLNEIKSHFAKGADDFEIVTDIENRIAEMFREILFTQQKQAISIEDVQLIIAQMGTVRDFENIEAEEEGAIPVDAPVIKRLFRDTENGMVAGVCAGLGHYLNLEDRWIRLAFLILIFFGGAGFLAYLVMWIIVPRATTRSERMYMKGEPVNLQGFIRNFQEEVENNELIKRSGGFIKELVDLLGKFLAGSGRIIFKLFAGFIILTAAFMLLSVVVLLASFLGFFDGSANDFFPFSMVDASHLPFLLFAAFVTIAVPLLALILFTFRAAFNGRPIHRSVSFGMLIIWLFGVCTAIFYVAKVSAEFKEEAEFTQESTLTPYPVYTLEMDNSRFFSKEDSVKYQIQADRNKGRVILQDYDGAFNVPRNVRIHIERSLGNNVSITQNYSSQGRNFETALRNAQNIAYDFVQQDSLLRFSPKLHLNKATNWRNQEVEVTVKVPVGTKLILNEDLDRYLSNYGSWSCNREDGVDHEYTEWVMTTEGLKCVHEINTGEPH